MSNLWVSTSELGDYSDTEFSYDAAKAASYLLWVLSGRKYTGVTTVTERYVCASRTYQYGPASGTYTARLIDGDVHNLPMSRFDFYDDMTSDGLAVASRLRLRGRPVSKIHAIRDRAGNVIDPNRYYLVDHSTIQPVPGVPWLPCNIEVTYSYGVEPPTMGKAAARMLAIEFARLWAGEDCNLPQRVTSISRQGVSYTVLDPQGFVDELRTGIYAIDLFLKAVNPDKAKNKARVFSPDVARGRRLTPKEPKYGVSPIDLTIVRDGIGTMTTPLSYLNAEFLIDETGWIPELILYNYSGSKSLTLPSTAVQIDEESETLQISMSYAQAFPILGFVEPGTWQLYASRPSVEDPTETETVDVGTGNVKITMATNTIQAFTIGA